MHVLNATARMIYNLYVRETDPSAIEEAMRNHFQVGANQDLPGDVTRCLEELRSKQLIEF